MHWCLKLINPYLSSEGSEIKSERDYCNFNSDNCSSKMSQPRRWIVVFFSFLFPCKLVGKTNGFLKLQYEFEKHWEQKKSSECNIRMFWLSNSFQKSFFFFFRFMRDNKFENIHVWKWGYSQYFRHVEGQITLVHLYFNC